MGVVPISGLVFTYSGVGIIWVLLSARSSHTVSVINADVLTLKTKLLCRVLLRKAMLTQSPLRTQGVTSNEQHFITSKAANDDSDVEDSNKEHEGDRIYSCCSNTNRSEGWWVETFGPFTCSTCAFSSPTSGDDSCRVFRGGIARFATDNDVWDLTDSLVDLYETEKRREALRSSLSGSTATAFPQISSSLSWLNADRANGFIRIFPPESHGPSQLVPCSLSTTTHRLCLQLGISNSALHVQFSNGIVQRLEPQSYPLGIQNDFLANLGHSDIASIQQEGSSDDLQYLVKFFSGMLMSIFVL